MDRSGELSPELKQPARDFEDGRMDRTGREFDPDRVTPGKALSNENIPRFPSWTSCEP
jgi:hypothetical protein